MQLLSAPEEEAPNKQDYIRFLRKICIYKEEGISENQENIYKLFKK